MRYVSVKFAPIGRPQTFLLNDLVFGGVRPVAATGDRAVRVGKRDGAIGDGRRGDRQTAPPEHSPNRVVRKATAEDVMVRLKRQQRGRAHRCGDVKIRERASR